VAAVFTPKDYGLSDVVGGILAAIRRANRLEDDLWSGEV
jgi:hypothetical protein